MSGQRDLQILLEELTPVLLEGEFVFCTFPSARYGDHVQLEPIAAVVEGEGLTLVVPRRVADGQGQVYEAAFRCITLMVHSSLEAVGLTASVASALAAEGVSANVIAGYFHDHVFVHANDADRALRVLSQGLS